MLAEMLYGLFEKIWEEEEIPSEWKEGLLIKISPRKKTLVCVQIIEDHTPVCARESVEQSHPGKVKRAGRSSPPGSEDGFTPGRSCTDQITTLRIIVE